jgi:site-specific recombinase XerD
MKSIHLSPGLNRLVEEYHHHLSHAAGLAPQTCAQRVRYVRRYLRAWCRGRRFKPRWSIQDAPRLLRYLLKLSRGGCHPHTLSCQAGAVRSFLRFLRLSGRAPVGLEHVLPSIRQCLPDPVAPLTARQVHRLLCAFDSDTAAGIRDYAMVLLAARLGLRAQEITQLRLQDVDWQAHTLCLQRTKGRRSRLLPLLPEVAGALRQYVRTVRPKSSVPEFFLCLHRARALGRGTGSSAVVAAFGRAGLAVRRPGPHLLRHTLATHLLQQGVSLKAIADLLGHQCLNTTTLYAKVDVPMLAGVTQPWPEVRR